MTSSPAAVSLLLALAFSVAVACGAGASRQPTPIAAPDATQPTPIAAPTDARGTPIAAPTDARGTPVATPVEGRPTQGAPVAAPTTEPRPTPIAPAQGTDAPAGRAAEVLAAHNAYRARHCAPPLRWSPSIAQVAQRYADELAASGCAFRHSRSDYGENLMRFSPAGSRDPQYVVDAWYEEARDYDYRRPGFSMTTGHFTQVVWAGSTELGCGVAVCDGGETWVCNYAPPGNVAQRFPDNVRAPTCR